MTDLKLDSLTYSAWRRRLAVSFCLDHHQTTLCIACTPELHLHAMVDSGLLLAILSIVLMPLSTSVEARLSLRVL